jgi:ATP-binding cassette subfamily B protein
MPAAAAEWRDFAGQESSHNVYAARLRRLGIANPVRQRLLTEALRDDQWRSLATLDAAIRVVQSLRDAGAVRSRRTADRLLERFLAEPELIPARYWSVRPAPLDSEGAEQVMVRGAVLVRVLGLKPADAPQDLGPELSAAISNQTLQPGRELLKLLLQSGRLAILFALFALFAAAAGTLVEALLFRGLLDVSSELGLAGQRMGAITALALFCLTLLAMELPVFSYAVRIGRHMENRLRIAFLEKIPKLGDRYFQSRLISDMAERSHAAQRLRDLAGHIHQLLRAILEFCCIAAGIVWLEPAYLHHVLTIAAVVIVPGFAVQALLAERDLRARTHAAGLTRFYLDAMLGLVAIRAHGAEKAVRREHERFLGEWADASIKLQRTVALIEGLQLSVIFGLIIGLFLWHPLQGAEIGRVLLIAYWALNLPALGQEIGTLLRQYPAYRNLTLRLIEPLGAPEESESAGIPEGRRLLQPPSLGFRTVSVEVSGHRILDGVTLDIEAGSHIAIVGPSGAGKSTLLGIILGWLKPSSGELLVNGVRVDTHQLRASLAWVDPAVQLWNRSLLSNVSYGSSPVAGDIAQAIDDAMLRSVLEALPSGLQTELGENGGLVSGGEGQRVRLARAFLRKHSSLVLLDEPFRGLDRDKRSELLSRARRLWKDSTLLCVTHDLAETLSFDRVLVIENGRLVENGCPRQLYANTDSRYAQLLAAEQQNRSALWSSETWRRLRLHAGRIVEDVPARRQIPETSQPQSEVA